MCTVGRGVRCGAGGAAPGRCGPKGVSPNLGGLYNRAAQYHGPDRNPVIVIPGILGSKLVDPDSGRVVWGAFTPASVNPKKAADARLIALPMRMGVPLRDLTDRVATDGALDRVRVNLLGLPIELSAYAQVLETLGAGGYMDQQLAEAGAIDYGSDHFTCFQFAYDWRRDNVENAHLLGAFIDAKRAFVQRKLAGRFGGEPGDYDVKFDIVAHSMGGLLTRYWLRFGNADLPDDGSTPAVTWAGATHIDNVIMVGTPNAGAAGALDQLTSELKIGPTLPVYPPAVLGTMPAIYQLLPRARHGALVLQNVRDAQPVEVLDPTDLAVWSRFEWGLLDPKQDRELQKLLPDVADPLRRRAIAVDHAQKCLARAAQFHKALDQPAPTPDTLSLHLVAGDAMDTPERMAVAPDGVPYSSLPYTNRWAPGDGTVTRASALLDERAGSAWSPTLRSPIDWANITFLHEDHLGLTKSPTFNDNILFLLLERPAKFPSAGDAPAPRTAPATTTTTTTTTTTRP